MSIFTRHIITAGTSRFGFGQGGHELSTCSSSRLSVLRFVSHRYHPLTHGKGGRNRLQISTCCCLTRSGLPVVQVRTARPHKTRGHTISDAPVEGVVLAVNQKHKRLSCVFAWLRRLDSSQASKPAPRI